MLIITTRHEINIIPCNYVCGMGVDRPRSLSRAHHLAHKLILFTKVLVCNESTTLALSANATALNELGIQVPEPEAGRNNRPSKQNYLPSWHTVVLY